MTEAELIRAVFPRHTVKLLARMMDVPFPTARHWVHVHFSAARRHELATKLLVEFGRQDERRAAVRQQLNAIAGKNVEMEPNLAGEALPSPQRRLRRSRALAG